MVGKYKVITLCGSTKFRDEFLEANRRLTLEGNIILMPGVFGYAANENDDKTKQMLIDVHQKRIDMSDEIFVINVGGYIGNDTQTEIKYAKQTGKIVKYMVPMEGDKANMRNVDKYINEESEKEVEFLSETEFIYKYCDRCGSQRCDGPYSEMFEGCSHRNKLRKEK